MVLFPEDLWRWAVRCAQIGDSYSLATNWIACGQRCIATIFTKPPHRNLVPVLVSPSA